MNTLTLQLHQTSPTCEACHEEKNPTEQGNLCTACELASDYLFDTRPAPCALCETRGPAYYMRVLTPHAPVCWSCGIALARFCLDWLAKKALNGD